MGTEGVICWSMEPVLPKKYPHQYKPARASLKGGTPLLKRHLFGIKVLPFHIGKSRATRLFNRV